MNLADKLRRDKASIEWIDRIHEKALKKVNVITLNPVIGNKYNIDFGGRELLSSEFNNFLDKRFNEVV